MYNFSQNIILVSLSWRICKMIKPLHFECNLQPLNYNLSISSTTSIFCGYISDWLLFEVMVLWSFVGPCYKKFGAENTVFYQPFGSISNYFEFHKRMHNHEANFFSLCLFFYVLFLPYKHRSLLELRNISEVGAQL